MCHTSKKYTDKKTRSQVCSFEDHANKNSSASQHRRRCAPGSSEEVGRIGGESMVECSLLRTNPNDMFGLDMVGVLLAEVFGVLVF